MTLKFGTSGLRGLVSELQGPPAFTYTLAFVRMLRDRGALDEGSRVYVGRDLRASIRSEVFHERRSGLARASDASCERLTVDEIHHRAMMLVRTRNPL